ncbi:CbbQ/NirQ/NorQ/GpvN family protein [Stutzerimonas balearica]|uniref:ATPase AAA n=3 Tax=Stutzerimonas TaxID=2901164 RepID=A0A8D3Y3H6_9GAMM|nr:CbbQ/NirQ/NorQ/GpvN family protein [Stutzerimonas balearica]TVT70435.1 MAG: CbbQ/NirQ/NorQ/GpvN family protein [Pseudomonas sp.]AJE16629.1 ATPase AAA [Stutzerimonas balearica DSM 6083]MBK3749611.1 AAA domain-containing protein [Stutzerimonas balearica]MBK3827806.1 AAA domain-containing protein [Stutzerimonas balearica]MBK3857491.1 AAA domain-containing protein [Stutzerimonas balearica]
MNAPEFPTAAGTPDIPFYQPQGNEERLFTQAWQHGMPVLIKGPTGCGKTRFVQHMAHRLGLPLYTVACHDDLSAADLVGRHLIGAQGTWWQDGPLTRAVREGGICYLDEVVEARQDTAVVLHPLADDRRELFIERTGEALKAPPGFMLVVSYNPGYQNLLKGMKPSTRQRFVAMRFDYPSAAEEERIVANEAAVEPALAAQVVKLGQALRRLEQHDLEEVASTRLLIFTARMIGAGMSPREACLSCLAEPLSDDPQTVAALMDVVDVHFG